MSQYQYKYPYPSDEGGRTWVEELIRKDRVQEAQRKMNSAIYNPLTGWVHLMDQSYRMESDGRIPWNSYPKVLNANRYQQLIAKSAGGTQETRHANSDQQEYGFYAPEWQDEALRAHSAGIITSTEFPAITTTSVLNELLRLDVVTADKYNLLEVISTQNTDKINVFYPEYNDTTKKVRVGYKENDPIETTGFGAFTTTGLNLEKSGVGIGFTEEFFMKQYEAPIQQILLEGIANDFARVKHERIVSLLPSFADLTGAPWAAYTAGNMHSTNRPTTDLNAARAAINADKIGRANTIVSNEAQWTAYDTNTWTAGLMQPVPASNRSLNDIITNPRGIPWCQTWAINEDIGNNKAFVFDSNAIVRLQGPRVTTTFQNNNPQQTVTIMKDWFKIHLRKSQYGRELVSI